MLTSNESNYARGWQTLYTRGISIVIEIEINTISQFFNYDFLYILYDKNMQKVVIIKAQVPVEACCYS